MSMALNQLITNPSSYCAICSCLSYAIITLLLPPPRRFESRNCGASPVRLRQWHTHRRGVSDPPSTNTHTRRQSCVLVCFRRRTEVNTREPHASVFQSESIIHDDRFSRTVWVFAMLAGARARECVCVFIVYYVTVKGFLAHWTHCRRRRDLLKRGVLHISQFGARNSHAHTRNTRPPRWFSNRQLCWGRRSQPETEPKSQVCLVV